MPDRALTAAVQRISEKCTFLAASELEETICHICLNDSLGPQGSEFPVKLCCGHNFGMACLTKWVSDSIRSGRLSPTCPICRTKFLGRAISFEEAEEMEEDEDGGETTPEVRRQWHLQLSASSPVPGRVVFSEAEEWFIIRAEYMWVDFCKAIYDHIDRVIDPAQTEDELLRDFFEEKLPVAQYVLSYGTVYNFFVAFCQPHYLHPDFKNMVDIVRRWIPNESNTLLRHLADHNDVDSGARWRIRQGCGVEFAARLHNRQSRLRLH